MPAILENYLTRPQLAAELGVNERTIIRWCDRGEGPPVTKIGHRPMFRRAAVAEWLAAREVAA